MGYQQHPGDLWEGLEPTPEPPEKNNNRTLILAIGGVGLLVGLVICLVAGYLVLLNRTGGTETATPTAVAVVPPEQTPADPTTPAEQPTTPPDNNDPTPTIASPPTDTPPPTDPPPTEAPEITVSGLAVSRFASPPGIDGNLSEWAGQPTVQSQFLVFSATSWDGSDDLAATWQLGWDNDALYVAVQVEDNLHVQNQTGDQIFKGDSVDMQIDTNVNAGAGQLNSRTFQITISPGDFAGLPPSYYLFRATDAGSFVSDPAQGNIQVAAAPTGSGYIIEARIPWSTLEMTPAAGQVLGIALNVSDNDSPGNAIQEVMKSHVATRTLLDPSSWGRLTLVE